MKFKLEFYDETLDCWSFVRSFLDEEAALYHLKLYNQNFPDYVFRVIKVIDMAF